MTSLLGAASQSVVVATSYAPPWLKKSTFSVPGLDLSGFFGVRLELLLQIWDLLDLTGQLGNVF